MKVGEHGGGERRALGPWQALEMAAEDHGGEVLVRVGGLDRPRLRQRPDLGEAPREAARPSPRRRVPPRAGPATTRLRRRRRSRPDVRDVAGPPHWAASRPPGFSAAYRRANSALVVRDPVERRGREDRVDGLVSTSWARSDEESTSSGASRVCSTIGAIRRRRSRGRAGPPAARRGRPSRRRARSSPWNSRRGITSRAIASGVRHALVGTRVPVASQAYVRTLSHTVAQARDHARCLLKSDPGAGLDLLGLKHLGVLASSWTRSRRAYDRDLPYLLGLGRLHLDPEPPQALGLDRSAPPPPWTYSLIPPLSRPASTRASPDPTAAAPRRDGSTMSP